MYTEAGKRVWKEISRMSAMFPDEEHYSKPKRFFKLKDGSIVAKFGSSYNVLVRSGLYFGTEYQNRIWVLGDDEESVCSSCQEIDLDDDDISYELRFRPGDLVRDNYGGLLKISTIPCNCGGNDYGMWRIENGQYSSSLGINDSELAAGESDG